jgi:GT2 family glycosyltransferase
VIASTEELAAAPSAEADEARLNESAAAGALGPAHVDELWSRGWVLDVAGSLRLRAGGPNDDLSAGVALFEQVAAPEELGRVARLVEAVDGMLLPEEIRLLYAAARQVDPGDAIVEIGSWKGRSTAALALGAVAGGGARAYAVDHHRGQTDIASWLGVPLADIGSWPAFSANLAALGLTDAVEPVVKDSLAAEAAWRGPPVGLLWIDGQHDYAGVAADFEAWRTHVRPGGMIAFHDSTGQFEGIAQLVGEAIAEGWLGGAMLIGSTAIGLAPERPYSPLLSTPAMRPTGGPRVSIVMPAHNEGESVRRTVESVLAGTDAVDFEMLLVDDGSSDRSFDFLDEPPYRGDGRFRRHRFDQSVGCVRARHEAVRLARGEDVLFLDAHMAVLPGWLETLVAARERLGGRAAVAPDVAALEPETWQVASSWNLFMMVDERLDFVWQPAAYADLMVPTFGGMCMLMPRFLYFEVGGFDLGLRRWGSEFTDLTLKVYAAGGTCHYEPAARVGHLFRATHPYAMSWRDITYNQLRAGFVHLPEESYRRLVVLRAGAPEFAESLARVAADRDELEVLRRQQRAANRRDPDWFVRAFLPGLCAAPSIPSGPACACGAILGARYRYCGSCGGAVAGGA